MSIITRLVRFIPFIFLFSSYQSNAQCDSLAIDLPFNSIDEDCDGLDQLYIHLPAYSYAVEGQEFALFFDNVILAKNSYKYRKEVLATFSNSVITNKKWTLTPTAAQVGEHQMTIVITDQQNRPIASASTTLRISAKQSPPNSLGQKFILLGHSLVDQGVTPQYLRELCQAPGTPQVTFHGTKISYNDGITRHEGKGGASWRYFANDTLSPLFYQLQRDVRHYFDQVVCAGCNPDVLVIQLDVNDYCFVGLLNGKTIHEINDFIEADYLANTKPLIDAIRLASPNTKIAICYTPPANGRPNILEGFFPPGSVLASLFRWKKICQTAKFKYSEYFAGRENENIYLIPSHFGVDEIEHFDDLDPIHPYPQGVPENGYHPISRSIFSWLKWVISKTPPNTCALDGTVKQVICDRKNTTELLTDDTYTFAFEVNGKNAGTNWTTTIANQTYTGTFGADQNFGPYLSTAGTLNFEVKAQSNPACSTRISVSNAGCSFGPNKPVDLLLSMSAVNTKPAPFTTFKVKYTVVNQSANPAEDIFISIPKPPQVSYPNADPYTASQGTFDWFYTFLWDLGDLPPQGTATLEVDFYLLDAGIFPLYSEVYALIQEDVNSIPCNGNGVSSVENDESSLTIGVTSTENPNIRQNTYSVHPNPVLGQTLYLNCESAHSSAASVRLIDLTGRTVQQWETLANDNRATIALPLKQTLKGMYLLQVQSAEGTWTTKLVSEQ
jgi:hypothetical protein